MLRLIASVGSQGTNRKNDVIVVQRLLNQHKIPRHPLHLKIDGIAGPKTIKQIVGFQKHMMNMRTPDGRVDPNGKTIAKLNETMSSSKVKRNVQMSIKGMEFLKSIEDCRLKPYDDQTGKEIFSWVTGATIGYGHLISQIEWNNYKNGITKKQADALFSQDLLPYVHTVESNIEPHLDQNQLDALVILVFNIGPSHFKSSSVLKLINNPSTKTPYSSLEAAWMAWNKSQGKVNKGVNNRRKAEWNIYSKNIYKKW